MELDDMLCLLPAEARNETIAFGRLDSIFTRVDGNSQRLRKLTASGVLKTAQVNIGGRVASVFWYRVEAERLIVDTIISLARDVETLPRSVIAMEEIAKACGCDVIEGTTARCGVAEALRKLDWYPVGVTLRKDC